MNMRHAIDTYRGHTIPTSDGWSTGTAGSRSPGVLILLSLGGLLFQHLNFSIDFEGGAQISYTPTKPVSPEQVKATLRDHGIEDAEVQIVNGESILIRTLSLTSEGVNGSAAIRRDLAAQAGIDPVDVNIEDVGPTWGGEISRKAASDWSSCWRRSRCTSRSDSS